MMRPHNDNIIFYDTEFTDLDPKKGALLSLGLVKPNGEELYLELHYSGDVHPWVTEYVLPHLHGEKVSNEEAREVIREFIGDSKPHLVSYINQLDAVYWYDLFGSAQDHPAAKHPIDFASILFGYGYATHAFSEDTFLKKLGLSPEDRGRGHNALDDARFLKEVYYRFFSLLESEDTNE